MNPAKLKTPKTNPDCDVSTPLYSASFGKKGGSSEPQIPQIVLAEPTVITNNTILDFDIVIKSFMLKIGNLFSSNFLVKNKSSFNEHMYKNKNKGKSVYNLNIVRCYQNFSWR